MTEEMARKMYENERYEPRNWLCKCGERGQLTSDWRFTGDSWEHYHGYPIGHVAASYKPRNGK